MTTRNLKHRFRDGDFKKSRWSKNNPKTCVEVARDAMGVAVRDSKNPAGGTLFFSNEEWDAFTKGVLAGEFNTIK